ncbi:MAG: hypothetical protein QY332_08280 [Anaerolineales bacterium]|nr:MAG: hypothetical protein QY332_08280 [Anaerolineales bacterium]
MKRKPSFILYVLLIIALSACNLPGGATPTPDFALTLTAQAQLLETGTPALVQETATPELTSAPDSTPTPSVPTVNVSVNTNCRTGPSTQYDNIDSLLIGQTAEIVGKNTQTGYWIIKRLNGSGTCWLFPQYATVSGNTANLPEYPVPPTPTPSSTPTATTTPTPSAPAAVDNVTMNMACPNAIHSGTLQWEDKSNNEDGFNIYANSVLLASIPANSTSYNVASAPGGPFLPGIASIFEVEAFNAAGKASKKSVTKGCP